MVRPRRQDGEVVLPCACANLRRAARAVTQLYEGELRRAGVRATQFTLLQVLAKAGPIRQGRLGEVLAMDSTTLTRTLRLLLEKGWIRRAVGADRRQRYFELTPAGQRQAEKVLPYWERAQRRLKKSLGLGGWAELERVSVGAARAARAG